MPQTAIELSVRPTFDLFLAGQAAHQPIASVFSALGGGAADLGLRFFQSLSVYIEWEHIVYRVGDNNPYNLQSVAAWRDFIGVGFRRSGAGDISIVGDFAAGYSVLAQAGTAGDGGKASIAFPSWQVRAGAGVSFRFNPYLGLEPMLTLDLGEIHAYVSNIQLVGSQPAVTVGTVKPTSVRLGLGVGVSATFGVPL